MGLLVTNCGGVLCVGVWILGDFQCLFAFNAAPDWRTLRTRYRELARNHAPAETHTLWTNVCNSQSVHSPPHPYCPHGIKRLSMVMIFCSKIFLEDKIIAERSRPIKSMIWPTALQLFRSGRKVRPLAWFSAGAPTCPSACLPSLSNGSAEGKGQVDEGRCFISLLCFPEQQIPKLCLSHRLWSSLSFIG